MSQETKKNLIELGTCYKPHGIKGAFLFKLHNQEDSVLAKGEDVLLFPASSASSLKASGQSFTIDEIHFGNKVICYLKDIRNRNIVEDLIPFVIKYPREKFPELKKDEWYIEDLVGLKVFDQDGHEIGIVENHYDNGAQVVLNLKVNGKKMDLPFVETFFPYVDIKKNKIVLVEPDYD